MTAAWSPDVPPGAGTSGPVASGPAPRPGPEAPKPRKRRRPTDIGTDAERAVVRHLIANGFPGAERRRLRGRHDAGDVTGTPGICWQVKGGDRARNASDNQVAAWLDAAETQRVNAGADIAVLVVQRAGVGPANAGRWWAVLHASDVAWLIHGTPYIGPGADAPVRMHLADAVTLLRAAGYGDPLTQDLETCNVR